MVSGSIKSQVDKIWDTLWTGGLTNPISAVEQITYLLFIKMLDDQQMDKEAGLYFTGGELVNPTFPKGEWSKEGSNDKISYEEMRWHNFKDYEPVKMVNVVQNFVFPFIKTLGAHEETAFSKYMGDAAFQVTNPLVLAKIVDIMSKMDTNDTDLMGDVYEYLLDKMASNGVNGQFRTPRHIIRMIVQLMKPTLNDRIIDPAMGSAGFLIESAQYIQEHQKDDLMEEKNQEKYNSEVFTGFDTDLTMLRLGAMNMMLHGVHEPNIQSMDSVSKDNTEREAYTLILANPPFKGSVFEENISGDLQIGKTKTTKTELLFVSLFIQMLEVGGRCACIVPDGVLFGTSKAHHALRKELVENQKLEAVISMPSGVFKPYSGVSTAILIFTKTNAGGTDLVWFYDMKADGFSLDDKRVPVNEDDREDIVYRYYRKDNEKKRSRTEKSFFVEKDEIGIHNYDLAFNTYKKIPYTNIKYPSTKELMFRIRELQKENDKNISDLESILL